MESRFMSNFGYTVVGVLAGAAAVILFAPRNSAETGKTGRGLAGAEGDYLKARGCELSDRAGDIVEKGRDWVNHGRGGIKSMCSAKSEGIARH